MKTIYSCLILFSLALSVHADETSSYIGTILPGSKIGFREALIVPANAELVNLATRESLDEDGWTFKDYRCYLFINSGKKPYDQLIRAGKVATITNVITEKNQKGVVQLVLSNKTTIVCTGYGKHIVTIDVLHSILGEKNMNFFQLVPDLE